MSADADARPSVAAIGSCRSDAGVNVSLKGFRGFSVRFSDRLAVLLFVLSFSGETFFLGGRSEVEGD